MTPETARCFGHMLAAQARVAAMQAENAWRKSCGNAPAYDGDAFFSEANLLEQLAIQVINQ